VDLHYPQAQVYRILHAGHVLGAQERAASVALFEHFLNEADHQSKPCSYRTITLVNVMVL
jgi:hypothetical protein